MVFTNLTGIVSRSLPNVVKVEPDGTVSYRQHYTAKFSQPLRLSDFPKDKHTFLIQAAAAEYGWDQLEFVPETAPWDPSIKGGAMADELSLPDWNILGYEAVSMPYRPIKAVNQAGFGIRFEAQRYFVYYLWQIVLPMSVVVVMSWAAFWVGRQEVSVRIGIATSSILTMVAYRFVLASLLPKLPYMTRMDYLTVGSTVLVFLALFMVVVITSFGLYRKELWAEKLNVWSRVGFPAAYLFLLGAFILT